MKPLISYYGGKQRIASQILSYFPRHTVYVEPFCGGAALLFAKPKPVVTSNHNYREVLNDTNDLVINLYRVAIEQREALELKIMATLYSQSDYRKAGEIIRNPDGYSDLEKAWAFYVSANQSFANKVNTGWGTSTLAQNHAATWHNKKLLLKDILDRVNGVYISCEDAIRCIQRWDSPQALFYCDPPYPNTHQGHYTGYTFEDFRLLCETLDNIQGSYVLSNYPQEVEPKSARHRVEIEAVMSVKKAQGTRENNKRTEVLWVCDRSGGMREELNAIASGKPRHLQLSLV